MKKVILSIEGMTCSACSNGLEKYLNKQDGIINASVNLVLANASIEYDDKKLELEDLDKFVERGGFKSLGEFKPVSINQKYTRNKRTFIVFTVLAIALMYISMGDMVGLPSLPYTNPNHNPMGYLISLIVLTITFLIYGLDIIHNGYKNIIHKTPNMDSLVGIGVLTSFLYSIYNVYLVYQGQANMIHHLYFESSAIVIYFVKLGRLIDGISKDKTKDAISKLVKLTPSYAFVLDNGKTRKITIDEVNEGDILVVKPGDKIAVDGIVVSGKSHIDESFITGESKPVAKTIDSKVLAGSINYDGFIEYKATKIGKNSAISQIINMVIEASNTKPEISRLADKVSGIFVPVVMIIALLSFSFYCFWTHNIGTSINTFVTILVVACPCSLGLATPLAITVSQGICASKGILIRTSSVLENAKRISKIFFDKTGTLTYGKPRVDRIFVYSNFSNNEVMKLACSLETKSSHPISSAFKQYATNNRINIEDISDFSNIEGKGLLGKIGGCEVIVGNHKLLEDNKISYKAAKLDINCLTDNNDSLVYIAFNNELVGLVGVNDIIRQDAPTVINDLKSNSIEPIMLTGDNETISNNISSAIGIDKVYSEIMPKDKASIIKDNITKDGLVAMCGDGINDSVALTSADIGISFSDASDIAIDSSDVILTNNSLESIIDLISISKNTFRIIKQNLFWAFFYNVLMIPVAIGALKPIGFTLSPMMASLAMVISSLTVVLNTLRLYKKRI